MTRQSLLKTFLDLISIPEVYPNEDKIIKYILKRFNQEKIKYRLDSFQNIIATIPGLGYPVLLNTHLDIVEPIDSLLYKINKGKIYSTGNNILGADPKSGLAVILEFASFIKHKHQFTHPPIEIVLTRGEESGLRGSRNLDFRLIKSKYGLVFDEEGPVSNVVVQSPAYVSIDAEIKGKSTHSAAVDKSDSVLNLSLEIFDKVKDSLSEGITWNVGLFNSGTARNTIPGAATLSAELRSFDTQQVLDEAKKVEKIFKQICTEYSCRCHFHSELAFKSYKLSKDTPLFKKLEGTFIEMEIEPNYFTTYGGSDANIFNQKGIATVSVGSGYHNAHQHDEYALLDDMEQIFEFLRLFIFKE